LPKLLFLGKPLSDFLKQNLAWGRESQVYTLMLNFTVVALKMWAYGPKNRQNVNFWYKFAPKGSIPLSDFLKIGLGEGVLGPYIYVKFHRYSFKMWDYSPQIAINGIFCMNLPLSNKSSASAEVADRNVTWYVL